VQIEPRPLLEVRAFAVTDAGSCALWDPEAFEDIVDEGAWEDDPFDDDALRRYIRAGHYVPVSVGADGTYEVLVRVGTTAAPAALTDRERRYLIATSEPYLLVTTGGGACYSNAETVAVPVEAAGHVPLPVGRWSVTVHEIDNMEEPGQLDAAGNLAATALPGFVLLIDPAPDTAGDHRTEFQTFD
jgi:hypothetical protein